MGKKRGSFCFSKFENNVTVFAKATFRFLSLQFPFVPVVIQKRYFNFGFLGGGAGQGQCEKENVFGSSHTGFCFLFIKRITCLNKGLIKILFS